MFKFSECMPDQQQILSLFRSKNRPQIITDHDCICNSMVYMAKHLSREQLLHRIPHEAMVEPLRLCKELHVLSRHMAETGLSQGDLNLGKLHSNFSTTD